MLSTPITSIISKIKEKKDKNEILIEKEKKKQRWKKIHDEKTRMQR